MQVKELLKQEQVKPKISGGKERTNGVKNKIGTKI